MKNQNTKQEEHQQPISKHRYSLKDGSVILLSFFGTGFFPYAPGTFSSLVFFLMMLIPLWFKVPVFFFIPIFIILLGGSFLIMESFLKRYELKDPSWIVIDEVLGFLLGWFLISPKLDLYALLYLILFRVFDILKPYPVSYFDQELKGSISVLGDDLVAGLYAALLTLLVRFGVNAIWG